MKTEQLQSNMKLKKPELKQLNMKLKKPELNQLNMLNREHLNQLNMLNRGHLNQLDMLTKSSSTSRASSSCTTNTAIHNPNHWTLTGFQGTPFPNDTDSNTMHVVNFATEGRNPNTAAVELACGLGRKKWTQEIFKEAKAFTQFKGTTFLSGKARKQKAPPPSPSQERIMFWT